MLVDMRVDVDSVGVMLLWLVAVILLVVWMLENFLSW